MAVYTTVHRFQHKNLLELMGYCEVPPCLVYEFLEKGSLYDCLHTKQKFVFDWCKRSKVLKGACRGLTWLHNNKPPLIHQDIKSLVSFKSTVMLSVYRSNVLINSHFEAKLGDFGFSLEAPLLQAGRTTFTCPLVAFTQGYCAPELMEGHCSTKSDVYSYGMVCIYYLVYCILTFIHFRLFWKHSQGYKLMTKTEKTSN